jgi:hypothetical protein
MSVRAARPRRWAALVFGSVLAISACGGAAAPSEPESAIGSVIEETAAPPPTTTDDTAATPEPSTGEVDDGNGKPARIELTLSGTKNLSDGTYSSSGPARLCGDGVMHLTGNPKAFQFEFPLDGQSQIGDVTFSADDLLPGTSTSVFHVSVNVTTADGSQPAATVVHPDLAGSGDTGTASRSESDGTITLVVDGSDDVGQTIHMTATCGPR